MSKGKMISSRVYQGNPAFNYLPEGDKYFLASEKPKYKFNVIGTGIMGQEHIRVTMLEGRATINGVFDPNEGSVAGAKAQFAQYSNDELKVHQSLEAACLDPEVDGLIIATPNYTHIDLVKEAIKSGKHIMLEKPIATNLQDAHTIYEISEEYNGVFQIGLQYRYKPTYREVINQVKGGNGSAGSVVGDIKSISILEHRIPFLDKVDQWNKFSEFSGDTLVEKCCHYFDLLNLFAGARPVDVYASGGQAVNFVGYEYEGKTSDILDNALVIVNYENGVRASFNLCMFAPFFYEELIICGDEGHLKAWEKEDFLPQSSSGTGIDINRGDSQPSLRITPNYPARIQATGHHGATFMEHIDFVNNIDGIETPTATALEGLWSIAVASAAQESIKTGQVVKINDHLADNGIDI
ncbi:MAG: Gfo/Idh/MocA family oxidoreductase [Chloroflexota bacterium]